MKRYIEIDSTYRDRNRFPNPANFDVVYSSLGIKYAVDAISATSDQNVLYPSPETLNAVAFYEENLIGEQEFISEKYNYPYMYATNLGDTIIRLDELPISSQDSTTTSFTIPLEYPRAVIPPSHINNFYINDFLQNVLTGEVRKIIKYEFSSLDYIIQQGFISGYNIINPNNTLLYGQNPQQTIIQAGLSNIDGYYQGKYIRMTSGNTSGEESLIIGYYTTDTFEYIFKLQTPFSTSPEPFDSFNIVSKFNYFATIESPFSTSLPNYPVYRDPIPISSSGGFDYNAITRSPDHLLINQINGQFLTLVNVDYSVEQYLGLSLITEHTVAFYRTTDSTETVWEQTFQYSNDIDYPLSSLDVPIVSPLFDNPIMAFTQELVEILYYVSSVDEFGEVWNPIIDITNVAGATPANGHPIRVVFSIDAICIVYTDNGTGSIFIAHTTDFTGAGVWNIYDTAEVGIVGDAILIRTPANQLNPITPTKLDCLMITFQDDATNNTYAKISDDSTLTTWTGSLFLIASNGSYPQDFISFRPRLIQFDYFPTTFETLFMLVWSNTTGDLYFSIGEEGVFEAAWRTPVLITNSGTLNTDHFHQIEINSYVVDGYQVFQVYYIGLNDETVNVIQLFLDGQTYSPGQPIILETYGYISNIVLIQNVGDYTTLNPFIASAKNDIVTSFISIERTLDQVVAVPYVLRRNDNIADNDLLGDIVSATINTITLPLTASSVPNFYVGKYIRLFNESSNTGIYDDFYQFNEYRKISAYDSTTKTITVDPAFSVNPNDYLSSFPLPITYIPSYPNPFDTLAPVVSEFSGAVYSPNEDRVYFVPWTLDEADINNPNYKTLMYFDCATNETVLYTTAFTFGAEAYNDGVYDPILDRIYFVPYGIADQATWHYIDCTTGILTAYAHGATAINNAYWGGVYHTLLQRIYFVPYGQMTQANFHYIVCSTGVVTAYANTSPNGANAFAYRGGTYHTLLQRIYFSPWGLCYFAATPSNQWDYITSAGGLGLYATPPDAQLTFTPTTLGYWGAAYHTLLQRVYFGKDTENHNYGHYVDSTGVVQSIDFSQYSSMSSSGVVYSPEQQRIYYTPNDLEPSLINRYLYVDETGLLTEYTQDLITYPALTSTFIAGVYAPSVERIFWAPQNQTINPFFYYIQTTSTDVLQYEIVDVTDSFTPLTNIWNHLGDQQMKCHTVNLEHLSLPNVTLESGTGNRIAFYQYIYVEFTNITNPDAGYYEIISSNNPNSMRMLFHVRITNVNSPDRASFVSLQGTMPQTVKFNPHDSFRFAVYLPDGELFKTVPDTIPPFEPNPDIQVVAVFSFTEMKK